MLVLEGLVGLQELFSFFSITSQGIDMGYRDIEWFAETEHLGIYKEM